MAKLLVDAKRAVTGFFMNVPVQDASAVQVVE
jgi:hypothetical protein